VHRTHPTILDWPQRHWYLAKKLPSGHAVRRSMGQFEVTDILGIEPRELLCSGGMRERDEKANVREGRYEH
jgi:hypothetical protein